jgi:hypothetical protein
VLVVVSQVSIMPIGRVGHSSSQLSTLATAGWGNPGNYTGRDVWPCAVQLHADGGGTGELTRCTALVPPPLNVHCGECGCWVVKRAGRGADRYNDNAE